MTIKLINLTLLIFLPFLMTGVIRKTKAFFGARKGANILQPFYDFIKLIKKESVYSKSATLIFKYAPAITLACTVFAGLFVPMVCGEAILNFPGAVVIFAYSLGLSKFISLLASLETASSFEGMGASREACFTTIIEPAFFLIMASIMALSKIHDFEALLNIVKSTGSLGHLIIFFTVLALFIMLLSEGSRIPVDDPATHLELTMIHEVMILDNSSRELAIISWCAWAKMFLISSLIACLIIPQGLSLWAFLGCFIAALFLICIMVGILESAIARLRMSHVFEFIFLMNSFALIISSLTALSLYGV